MHTGKICLITFSNNADHQNVVYSMFRALEGKADVYTIGIQNPKSSIAPHTEKNFYVDCPLRPGITKGSFRFSVLHEIAKLIKREKIQYLYFESMHLWNSFLMMLCPQCTRIVAVHDVLPHDGNKAMLLCNFVTTHQADHVILRNVQFKSLLAEKYHLKPEKITSFHLWRYYPAEREPSYSGTVLCFGRIRKYKGFDLFAQIIEQTPSVHYRVVGEPDEESVELVEKVRSYPNVEMIAQEVSDEEMERHFTECDWVVLPYFSATQSGVIVDACKYSRPTIAFNVGAIAEQIDDGVSGYLIPEQDTKAFAEKVNQVTGYTREQQKKFAHEAYLYGYKLYAAEAVSDRFLEIILQTGKEESDR